MPTEESGYESYSLQKYLVNIKYKNIYTNMINFVVIIPITIT